MTTQNPAEQATDPTPTPTTGPEPTGQGTDESTPSTDASGPTGQEPAADAGDDGFASLPESWQSKVSALRKEAGDRRTENKQLTDQISQLLEALDNAKDVEAAKEIIGGYRKTAAEATLAAARTAAIAKHRLSESATAFLTETDPAKIDAQAESLAALIGTAAPGTPAPAPANQGTPTGGLTPHSEPDPDDGLSPLERARKYTPRR